MSWPPVVQTTTKGSNSGIGPITVSLGGYTTAANDCIVAGFVSNASSQITLSPSGAGATWSTVNPFNVAQPTILCVGSGCAAGQTGFSITWGSNQSWIYVIVVFDNSAGVLNLLPGSVNNHTTVNATSLALPSLSYNTNQVVVGVSGCGANVNLQAGSWSGLTNHNAGIQKRNGNTVPVVSLDYALPTQPSGSASTVYTVTNSGSANLLGVAAALGQVGNQGNMFLVL